MFLKRELRFKINMKPKVSVVIPVYNVEKYINSALLSVFRQDYENIEIIVIDDGSTDASSKLIREFKNNYEFIYYKQVNSGLSAARNRGISLSNGDYIIFFDSDDVMPQYTISKCVKKLCENNASIVFFNADCIDENGDPLTNNFYKRPIELANNKVISARHFLYTSIVQRKYIVSACLYMAKREIIGDLRFPIGHLHEDNYFTTCLLIKPNVNVVCLDESLFLRRIRDGSIMSSKPNKKNVDGYLFSAKYFSEQLNVVDSDCTSIVSTYIKELLLVSMLSYAKASYYWIDLRARFSIFDIYSNLQRKDKSFILAIACKCPEIFKLGFIMKNLAKAKLGR